jgi:uncharacterized protein YutE (UPF0331/DUF86 family)
MHKNENAQKFINYFNEIHYYLKDIDNGSTQSYGSLIKKLKSKNKIVSYYYDQLDHFREIRNILVHESKYYAIPNDYSLSKIKKIKIKLINPKKVIPFF